jgi:hypothetical protein
VVESNVTFRKTSIIGLAIRRSGQEEEGCSKEVKASLEIHCGSNKNGGGGGVFADPFGKWQMLATVFVSSLSKKKKNASCIGGPSYVVSGCFGMGGGLPA